MKQIIEKLKEQIDEDAQLNNDPNESNWVREVGVILSANEARQIVEALEGNWISVEDSLPTREDCYELKRP